MRSLPTGVCALLAIAALLASTVVRPAVRLVYNASDSAPRGIYFVEQAIELRVGDYVIARLPETSAALAAERGYLPRSVPVLKQIAAIAGQGVCVRDGVVNIDGSAVARALDLDGQRRELHAWNGCRVLQSQEVFVLNLRSPASFDSRYFGPLDVSFVRGRATRW